MAVAVTLFPDAGPLITLAYADALDALLLPGWAVSMVDMVMHEITRNATPTSEKLASWVQVHKLPVLKTQVFAHHQKQLLASQALSRKANSGELAIQEAMHQFSLSSAVATGVFLFEDHKIARAGFILPENCRKVSTRAFLIFLQERGLIDSAAAIELQAIQAGRHFSSLRFPPN